MLSLVMLGPIYSLFSGMNVSLVFKILYPFILSFAPLGLFISYKRQTGDKIAFLSCFYFVTFSAFFVDTLAVARQEIAELFLILIVLVILEDRLRTRDRSLLLLVFGASLSVSHYGTSYVFLLILALALPIIYLVLPRVARIFKTGSARPGSARRNKDIKIFVAFFTVFTISWYVFVSPSSGPFATALTIGNSIVSNVGEMFSPGLNQPVAILTSQLVPLQIIERDIFLLSFFFILVGLLAVLVERKETKFTDEFIGFASGSFVFLVLATVLPVVAQSLQSDRVLTLSFIFLAPFCIIGLIRLLGLLSSSVKHVAKRVGPFRSHKNEIYVVVSIFLAVWVVFNSAFIYQLLDQPKVGRFALDNNVDFLRLNEQEFSNAAWLDKYQQKDTVAYADVNKATLLKQPMSSATEPFVKEFTPDQTTNNAFHHCYVFLGSYNLKNKEMLIRTSSSSVGTFQLLRYPKPA
jgi:uncharacterized membrane protein